MKVIERVLSILVLLLFISCSSDSSSDDIVFNDDNADITVGDNSNTGNNTNTSSTNLMGQFVSDAHPTSGTVEVNDDQTVLLFEDFMSDSGPQLLVYLSTTVDSTDFVNLGALQGINGNYSYTIPNNTDLSVYKYVVIWCVDFSVSFGHAELN